MTIKEELERATKQLKQNGKQEAKINVSRILAHILGCERHMLIFKENEQLGEKEKIQFNKAILELEKDTPIQYILKEQEFMKLKFYVDKNVLIPQPDTEILVEEAINFRRNNTLKILDLCTGSGCIGICCAYYRDNIFVIASDISKKALDIAKYNAKKHNVNAKLQFIQSDLFDNINEKFFDLIISNPPYIKTSIIPTLENEVQKEPNIALDGGNDGLDFYRKIADRAFSFLKNEGKLILEIGFDQKEDVLEILDKTNAYKNVIVKQDLGGNNRMVIAEKR